MPSGTQDRPPCAVRYPGQASLCRQVPRTGLPVPSGTQDKPPCAVRYPGQASLCRQVPRTGLPVPSGTQDRPPCAVRYPGQASLCRQVPRTGNNQRHPSLSIIPRGDGRLPPKQARPQLWANNSSWDQGRI